MIKFVKIGNEEERAFGGDKRKWAVKLEMEDINATLVTGIKPGMEEAALKAVRENERLREDRLINKTVTVSKQDGTTTIVQLGHEIRFDGTGFVWSFRNIGSR
jgi:hypothetical protein